MLSHKPNIQIPAESPKIVKKPVNRIYSDYNSQAFLLTKFAVWESGKNGLTDEG
jgi:hypothetical protein